MKRKYSFFLFIVFLVLNSCGDDSDTTDNTNNVNNTNNSTFNYRDEMRKFVISLSFYAKNIRSDFIIVPQNGQALITNTGDAEGKIKTEYLSSVDAVGREDLFFGYSSDDEPTPEEEKNVMLDLCKLCEANGVEVLTTDYCYSYDKTDESYQLNNSYGFISFAAPDRNLAVIPDYPEIVYGENSRDINNIADARNFLYLINGENFETKTDFISAVSDTNYDVIIMDLFHNKSRFFADEINSLKVKKNGGKRMVLCYMSIGEAEDYRFYWKEEWKTLPPNWLKIENHDWKGNYKVKYWDEEWQRIIFGNKNSYLDQILDAGFDGVYLDIIDAYEYFESLK